ncbi:MAG: hypothetical protein BZ138_07370 [Methanosphaera sp. rholeuAM270]|nr:MAG: hypothetical protein BZ138_07370 [Methanosphaera sp. rholeuAM270]
MTGLKIDFEINDSCNKKLSAEQLLKAMQKAMKETMIALDEELKDKSPHDTGHLEQHHTYEVNSRGHTVQGLSKNSEPYWFWQNFGTRKMRNHKGFHYVDRAVANVNPSRKLGETFKEALKKQK